MNSEIRFNRPANNSDFYREKSHFVNENDNNSYIANNKIRRKKPGFIYLTIFLVLIFLLLFVFNFKYGNIEVFLNRDRFSAVFLVNGQVYFGKIKKVDDSEILIREAYYLKVNKDQNSSDIGQNQLSFDLLRLSQEFHGPEDEIFINKDQVIFREYLRYDSEVLKVISSQKINK